MHGKIAVTLKKFVILVHYVLSLSFNLQWKHGILHILVTLSRLDESRHKITIKPMEKLAYIYKHSYSLLCIDFQLSNCFN